MRQERIFVGLWVALFTLSVGGLYLTMLVGGVYTACCYRPEGFSVFAQVLGGSLLAGFPTVGLVLLGAAFLLKKWRGRR